MGIFAMNHLAAWLRPLRRWLGLLPQATAHGSGCGAMRLHTSAGRGHVAWPPTRRGEGNRRPLRVLRVVDAGHAPCTAGRMVISGRMADVCAELDRLAALETAAA